MFYIENLACYADDKFLLVQDRSRSGLVLKMKVKLEKIINWLVQSGMVVNESKTDLCLFCRQDCPPLVVNINGKFLISRSIINILGVTFDCKLQWREQIASVSNKATKSINAIRLIRKFFTKIELLQLITANVFSVLYYNSEIWHLPSLKKELKTKLLSISARAIKIAMYYPYRMISFENIHKMNNRATPDSFMIYKYAIQLHKLYNENEHSFEWVNLNINQILTSRQTNFLIMKTNNNKVGLNILTNRLHILNGKIPLSWLNLTLSTFKVKCKQLLLGS